MTITGRGHAEAEAMRGAAQPLIELRNVAKQIVVKGKQEAFTAVKNVNLVIREGEFVAVVGPSGCGKSTLLNMIAGLDPATDGTASIDGRVLGNAVERDVGYLFQKDALLPWKTVLANVELALIFRKWPAEKRAPLAREWIARVGLAGFESYYPYQLSGGMRKRVSLAATFVYSPRILLMDEPFSALDVQTRNLMENELLELWQEHRKTVVFVTHDLEEAISLADRVIVLTANPGTVKREFAVDLGRPRNVNEIRFDDRFRRIHMEIWDALKEEVVRSYAKQRDMAHG
jgi:NitT/TauT family transport system ATP-binding protein